jgi:anaerobic ribonucleoside-triphosphate reductase activating protein
MTGTIDVSRIHFPVTQLGPGRRVGIWLQGCSIRCAGCISMDTWARGRGQTTVDEVLAVIATWATDAQGFTLSGGEPFDQPAALASLLRGIRDRSAADILVYTGYSLEQIAPQLASMAGLMDALISDPFDHSAPQTLALRGSDNQRLSCLTPLGRERFAPYERCTAAADRSIDVMFDVDGEVWLAGIPARDDLLRLARLLRAGGAEVTISQSAGGLTSQGAALP